MGFESAKNLILSGAYHVIVGCRDLAKGNAAVATLLSLPDRVGTAEALQLEVTDNDSVDAAVAAVSGKHQRLDILVNNAGICKLGRPRDVVRVVLETNVIGYVNVTDAFLPLLRRSASPRIVFVSSSTGSLTHASDPGHALHRAWTGEKEQEPSANEYRASNAARNMLMNQYWVALQKDGFLVHGADPGLNATNLTGDVDSLRKRGASDASVGGRRIATVVKGERDADAGRVCGDYGVCPW